MIINMKLSVVFLITFAKSTHQSECSHLRLIFIIPSSAINHLSTIYHMVILKEDTHKICVINLTF